MAAYQEQLKGVGFAGLGLRPAAHPMAETNGRFVGSKKCQACHEKSYDIWKKSKHASAYDTLVELVPPRNFDPECVSCHVVGWHPTRFFPYQSGFESLEKTPHLTNTGCEDCHGPGEKARRRRDGRKRGVAEEVPQGRSRDQGGVEEAAVHGVPRPRQQPGTSISTPTGRWSEHREKRSRRFTDRPTSKRSREC